MRKRFDNSYTAPKRANIFVVLLYLLLGAYFINVPFNFIKIPEYVSKFDTWIIFAGGVLMIFGAINYFRAKSN